MHLDACRGQARNQLMALPAADGSIYVRARIRGGVCHLSRNALVRRLSHALIADLDRCVAGAVLRAIRRLEADALGLAQIAGRLDAARSASPMAVRIRPAQGGKAS